MRLTEEDIKEINSKVADTWNEGIFKEPYGIPTHIKEHVIYTRQLMGGASGGSCWDTEARAYTNDEKVKFTVLDTILRKIKPDLSYLDYKAIDEITHCYSKTQWEYYGNYNDYEVTYIILRELYELLGIL